MSANVGQKNGDAHQATPAGWKGGVRLVALTTPNTHPRMQEPAKMAPWPLTGQQRSDHGIVSWHDARTEAADEWCGPPKTPNANRRMPEPAKVTPSAARVAVSAASRGQSYVCGNNMQPPLQPQQLQQPSCFNTGWASAEPYS